MKTRAISTFLLLYSTIVFAQNSETTFAKATDLDKAISTIDIKSPTSIKKLFTADYSETTNFEEAKFIRICKQKYEGVWSVNDFYVDGFLKMEGTYSDIKNETKEGEFKFYFPYNVIESQGFYHENALDGEWNYYCNSGSLSATEIYAKGNRVNENYFNENGSILKDKSKAQKHVTFNGKTGALGNFLSENLYFPANKFPEKITGKVIVSFWVNIDGSLEDIKVAKSLEKKADEEVLRVIKLMPKWIPARKHNCPVKEECILPVSVDFD
jgi:TonB family protein